MYYVFTLTSLFWSPHFALLCSLLKSFDVSKQKQLENDRNLSNLGPTKTSTSGRFVSVKPTKTTTGNRVRSSSAASEDGTVRYVWAPIVLEMDTDFYLKKKKLFRCVIVSCRCANFFFNGVWIRVTCWLKTQFGPQIFRSLYHFCKLVQVQLINLNCIVVQLNNAGVDFWDAETRAN